ncbi:MAG TPA: hypothetical protein VKV77_07670 [Methylovirgula sp.]|nr:hypothetical protein [Methylovirgula sp.]
MQAAIAVAISLHLLAGIFWAGTTFAVARTGGTGGMRLYRPQQWAAVIAVLAGAYLWSVLRPEGTTGIILGIGALCAIAAAGVQGAMAGRSIRAFRNGALSEEKAQEQVLVAQRIAALLLGATIVCMGIARYT